MGKDDQKKEVFTCPYFRVDMESLDYLERAIKLGYAHKSWLENDSDFDPLRENPRFQTLLKNLS